MNIHINKRHLSLVLALFILFLAINYWSVVAKFIHTIFSATVPLLIGCVIAYIVNIVLKQYEHLYQRIFKSPKAVKYQRTVGIIFAYLSIILIVALVFALIIPELVNCIKLLIDNHSHVINNFINYIEAHTDLEKWFDEFDVRKIKWEKVGHYLTTGLGSRVMATASSVFSSITTAVIAIFFSVYLLIYKEMLLRQAKTLLSTYLPRFQAQIIRVIKIFDDSFSSYIIGQCKDAVLLGISCFIGMSILRMPYASMIGVVTAFGALIPIVGAILGASVGVVIIFAISPVKAGIFLIFIILLQQLDNRVTYPLVVGKSIGLPSVWVFVAVIIGGGISGILGMMLTVPFFAALYKLVRLNINKQKSSQD